MSAQPIRKQHRRIMASTLERGFAVIWGLYGSHPAQEQVVFHPEREWMLDFAWINRLIALEIQGGGFAYGRHNRPTGQRQDCEKNNAAIMLDWRILTATTDMLREDPISICDQINYLLEHPALTPDAEHSMWTARVRSLKRDGMVASANGISVTRIKLRHYRVDAGGKACFLKTESHEVIDFILGRDIKQYAEKVVVE